MAGKSSKKPGNAKAATPAPKRMGRPPGGKRSNPDYFQTTVWLPKGLMADVKVKLIRSEAHEFSGLVEKLLREWLRH